MYFHSEKKNQNKTKNQKNQENLCYPKDANFNSC